jgi:hypothetical protein
MIGTQMTKKTTQEILHFFFTKEVVDLTPVDYKLHVEYSLKNKDEDPYREPNYPTLPEGTVVLASGPGSEDQEYLVVRTPDNTYYLVDEYFGLELFDETPEVDPKTPIGELYEITHSYNRSQYHYTSYTSRTGILLHSIIDESDYYMGGFYIYNKEYLDKVSEYYQEVKA